MKWEQRRLLEMAGILRRRTPDHLLVEGDDEGGGDDLFGDDSGGDDDAGGDDIFGDDSGGDDAGGEGGDDAGAAEEEEGSNRVPPEDLKPSDIEQFGSPRFLDVEQKITTMFNNCMVSAAAGAQELESYPGNAIKPTPAKDDSPVEEPAGDEQEAEEEGEDKNESFYRYGNRRDKWLINEAMRLLTEAEEEGAATDEFDMERFCTELANYMDTIHNTEDIEAGIFNSARQMILNNFGKDTESEFVDMLGAVTDGKWSFLQTGFEGEPAAPIAVGAGKDAGA